MTLSRKTDANLDRVFVENTLVFIDPKIERGGGAFAPTPLATQLDRGMGYRGGLYYWREEECMP